MKRGKEGSDEQHANTLTKFYIATVYKHLTIVMQHTMNGRASRHEQNFKVRQLGF